jgi:murein DD-endopeptidase MepM/ murein hydrolase activator NlpD
MATKPTIPNYNPDEEYRRLVGMIDPNVRLPTPKTYTPEPEKVPSTGFSETGAPYSYMGTPKTGISEQGAPYSFIAKDYPITQKFGNLNPIEKFSGGFNRGTDFATPAGTKVSVPSGEWTVAEAFGGAKSGGVGNSTNKGWGNSVKLVNRLTGETLRFSHLSSVNLKPGQIVKAGEVVGLTGSTGNSTGPHLDVEATNSNGRLIDVLQLPYGKEFLNG